MNNEQTSDSLTKWMDASLPGIVRELSTPLSQGEHIHTEDRLDLAGRNTIYAVLDDLLAVLFPVVFSSERLDPDTVDFFIQDRLRHAAFRLSRQIHSVFRYRCLKHSCDHCDCQGRAAAALCSLIESLPSIRRVLLLDVRAAYEGDPAAHSLDEIVLSYPCVEAIATYRIAHQLYTLDVPVIPRIMSERAHSRTGIDIHPGATIGPRFFIDHGTGVVIGETTTIGENVKIYQGVTLGALSFPLDDLGNPIKGIKRHPDIEDNVVIYANATILGGDTRIGKGAVIGGNTWITGSVAAGERIYHTPNHAVHANAASPESKSTTAKIES